MLNNKGQTLLEVIVALSIGVLVVSALVFATIFSLRNASFAKNSAIATKLAQEGIEKVKTARDTNQCISELDDNVKSWNGNNANCLGGSIWDFRISGGMIQRRTPSGIVQQYCEQLNVPNNCYFKINDLGALSRIGSQQDFPDSQAQPIPSGSTTFQRVVILSDDLNDDKIIDSQDDWQNAKKVTVIVRWTDFSGFHESKLSTILRKL